MLQQLLFTHNQTAKRSDILKTGLKKLEGEGNIDFILQKFLKSYRYAPSYALGENSPFQLMAGRSMMTKLNLLKPAEENVDIRNENMKKQLNAELITYLFFSSVLINFKFKKFVFIFCSSHLKFNLLLKKPKI